MYSKFLQNKIYHRFQSMLISNKNSNRSENFTKIAKTKKKKKKEMIQRNNECLPISTIVPA